MCTSRDAASAVLYLSRICSNSAKHLFTSYKGINEDETIYKLFKSSHALAYWYNHVAERLEHFPLLGCLARSSVHANFVLPWESLTVVSWIAPALFWLLLVLLQMVLSTWHFGFNNNKKGANQSMLDNGQAKRQSVNARQRLHFHSC